MEHAEHARTLVVAISLAVASASCGKGKSEGAEGGTCYGNGTCNPGLTCLSKLCVQSTGAPSTSAVEDGPSAQQKTAEAVQGIQIIYAGARLFYMEEGPQGPYLLKGDTGVVPPAGSCCSSADRKCRPDGKMWEGDLWQALKFSLEDPHYYSYQYVSDGNTFTIRAIGDLDCDGTYSTFEISGRKKGKDLQASEVIKTNELE